MDSLDDLRTRRSPDDGSDAGQTPPPGAHARGFLATAALERLGVRHAEPLADGLAWPARRTVRGVSGEGRRASSVALGADGGLPAV